MLSRHFRKQSTFSKYLLRHVGFGVNIQGILKQGCFEMTLGRIHYQWGFDRMVLKKIKETIRAAIGKRNLRSETIKEIANWLHELEFLIIKVMLFAIGVHHLYVYTMKTVF